MDLEHLFTTISDKLKAGASINNVYGKPIEVAGKTIIPIAKVSYGFGAGAGEGPSEGEGGTASGGGGGGCVQAKPIAVLEITEGQTRVIPIIDFGRIAMLGFVTAIALALISRGKK